MKVYTLIENTSCEGFRCEHGLSLYIETERHRILFDAGQSDSYIQNAVQLGVDLGNVDVAVLSHGHYDHGNGFLHFRKVNDTAPIFLSNYAFDEHFNAENQDIGLSDRLKSEQVVYCDRELLIDGGIRLVSATAMRCAYPMDAYGLKMAHDGTLVSEDFRHELFLVIEEKGKRFCFTGCAHNGILNIMEWFRPDVMVGGFHFKPFPPDSELLQQAARKMLVHPAVYYTGHCTGTEQYAVLKGVLGNRLHMLSSGKIFEL